MQQHPDAFIDDTAGEHLALHEIVHLYMAEEKWKPTKATQSQSPGVALWWGVLVQPGKEPHIANLKRYKFSDGWEVCEERKCTKAELEEWYADHELKRSEEIDGQSWTLSQGTASEDEING